MHSKLWQGATHHCCWNVNVNVAVSVAGAVIKVNTLLPRRHRKRQRHHQQQHQQQKKNHQHHHLQRLHHWHHQLKLPITDKLRRKERMPYVVYVRVSNKFILQVLNIISKYGCSCNNVALLPWICNAGRVLWTYYCNCYYDEKMSLSDFYDSSLKLFSHKTHYISESVMWELVVS